MPPSTEPVNRSLPEAWISAISRAVLRLALWVGAAALAIYCVRRLSAVVITLFVSGALAYIIRPIAGWMAHRPGFVAFHQSLVEVLLAFARPFRRRSPVQPPGRISTHVLRIFSTFYVLVLLFIGGWYSLRAIAGPFIAETTNVIGNWPEHRRTVDGYLAQAESVYVEQVPAEWRAWIAEQIEKNQDAIDLQRPLGEWTRHTVRWAIGAVNNIVEIVLLPVLAFYFALDSKRIKHEYVSALPRRTWREVMRMVHEFNRIMVSYVVGQAILCAIAGVVVGIGLALLSVRYPVMLGLLAAFTRAIPIIGPIIGGIPIIFFALATRGFAVALAVLTFFTFLHFAESKFIMPLLIGDRMRLHPVVIIVVLLIGAEFAGLLGMFFAPPVAALLRVMVRRYWLRDRLYREIGAPQAGPLGSGVNVPQVDTPGVIDQ